jgi:hypothetical protein
MSRLWFQFAGEMRKLFSRRRTNLGCVAFVLVELESVKAGLRLVI